MRTIIQIGGKPFLFFPVCAGFHMYENRWVTSLIATIDNAHTHCHTEVVLTKDKFSPMIRLRCNAAHVEYMAPASPELLQSITAEVGLLLAQPRIFAATHISMKIPDPSAIFGQTITSSGRVPILKIPASQITEYYTGHNYLRYFRIQADDYYQDSLVIIRNVKSVFNLLALEADGTHTEKGKVSSYEYRAKITDGRMNAFLTKLTP